MTGQATVFQRLSFSLMLLAFAGCQNASEENSARYPQRPIKLIVPFSAGGGSDTFARIIQKAIDDNQLLPQPLVIINVSGAGGTVGSRRVKNARPDGYTLLLLHEGLMTSRFAGKSSYGPEAFTPIAGTGRTGMTICVPEDSPYRNLQDLLEAAAKKPDLVLFSCNLGTPSHFAGLMLEKASNGSQFRFVNAGDGAKRFAGLQGGHADVTALSLAEYSNFKSSGLKALALLSPDRHPDEPDVLTAQEQGFDIIASNMQFWWAPKGTSVEKLKYVADVLRKAMQSDEVVSRLKQLKIEPLMLEAQSLQDDLADRSARLAAVSQRPTIRLPNFPLLALVAVGVLAVCVLWQERMSPRMPSVKSLEQVPKSRSTQRAIAVIAVTCLYVALMQFELVRYRFATLTYVFGTGLILLKPTLKNVITIGGLAVCMSFILHFLFTTVFVIDLP